MNTWLATAGFTDGYFIGINYFTMFICPDINYETYNVSLIIQH